jgi:hypothetical protein
MVTRPGYLWSPTAGFKYPGDMANYPGEMVRNDDCEYPQKSRFRRKAFIWSGIDMGEAIVRDSSNCRFQCQGVLARRAQNLYLAAGQPDSRGPVLAINTNSCRTKEAL